VVDICVVLQEFTRASINKTSS